ncbi:MAG: hypothetical protein J6O90_06625 [Candidatus Methanomethylophilaceae archaeon]|nr:hypothetical protein [Candidatus Methanomethylophilaceae archaeon]
MDRTAILDEIKAAEQNAADTVAKAESDKKAKIADARRMSVQKIQDAEEQLRQNYENGIAQAKEDLSSQREALLSAGREEAADLESKADAKIDEVKKFLTEEFERSINVTS